MKRAPHWPSRGWLLVVALCILGLRPVLGLLCSNLGWLQLARPEAWSVARESSGARALTWFRRAIAAEPSSGRAFLGAGIASVLLGDDTQAWAAWRKGEISPEVLIELGMRAHNMDDALTYYRGADEVAGGEPNEARYLAGQTCQRSVAKIDVLSSSNQCFCRDYFAHSGGNLILNGQFVTGNTWGWSGQFFFSEPASCVQQIDWSIGKPAPSLSITGSTVDRHHGLYQELSVSHGAIIRFSAWFRIEGASELEARLLYIWWEQNGQPQGNQQVVATSDTEWIYLQRTWQLPGGSSSDVVVYPVLLDGKGTIWVDDVQLVIEPSQ